MKTTLKMTLLALVAALMAAPAMAIDPAEGDDNAADRVDEVRLPPPVRLIDNSVQKLDLDEGQKEKYQQIVKQHAPQIQQHIQQQQQIYTPEQKQKRREVTKQGKDDGLQGQELRQFVQSKIELTPEQQKQHTDCQTNIVKSQQKFRQDVLKILTPQQQEKIPEYGGKKGKGKRGKEGKVRPDQAKPDQAKPDQAKPDQAEPKQRQPKERQPQAQ